MGRPGNAVRTTPLPLLVLFAQCHRAEVNVSAPGNLQHDGAAFDALVVDDPGKILGAADGLEVGFENHVARTQVRFSSGFVLVHIHNEQAFVGVQLQFTAFLWGKGTHGDAELPFILSVFAGLAAIEARKGGLTFAQGYGEVTGFAVPPDGDGSLGGGGFVRNGPQQGCGVGNVFARPRSG